MWEEVQAHSSVFLNKLTFKKLSFYLSDSILGGWTPIVEHTESVDRAAKKTKQIIAVTTGKL